MEWLDTYRHWLTVNFPDNELKELFTEIKKNGLTFIIIINIKQKKEKSLRHGQTEGKGGRTMREKNIIVVVDILC